MWCVLHQGLEGMSVPERAWELWDSWSQEGTFGQEAGGGGAARRNQAGLSCPAAHREERMLELELLSLGMGQRKLCRMGILQVTTQE